MSERIAMAGAVCLALVLLGGLVAFEVAAYRSCRADGLSKLTCWRMVTR